MAAVFHSAYCVIAASGATGSTDGLLKRTSRREFTNAQHSGVIGVPIWMPDEEPITVYMDLGIDEHQELHVFDDFKRDVVNGSLHQRGWAFQERALARRTIHFTKNQVYWECGTGIRCETMTKLSNTYEACLGDPSFPDYGLRFDRGGDIAFCERLFEQYSKLAFTVPEDRLPAIAGLERRLANGLSRKNRSGLGSYGVYNEYWGRGLLWQRALELDRSMTRLRQSPTGKRPAPSWSWMGHTGAISFIKIDPGKVNWLTDFVQLPWTSSASNITSSFRYTGSSKLQGLAYALQLSQASGSSSKSNIRYDRPQPALQEPLLRPEATRPIKCLPIGQIKPSKPVADSSLSSFGYYVLIISPSTGHEYERIGAGYMHGTLIDFGSGPESVSIG